ncbi:MAG: TRAP transporter small permease [Desulfobacteraceae bacterium]|jgi:TRAP-type C4-dicarboxylate transport system permease small subunit
MSIIEKSVNFIARWLNWLAAIAVVAVMVIVCINVLARSIFGMPLKGTVDIVSLLGVLVIGGAISYTQVLKGHVRITLFIDMLPKPARTILSGLVDLAGMVLFGILSWQTILFALGTHENGELSEVLKIPITPFAFAVSIGCISLTMVLLADLINVFTRGSKK